MAKTNKYASINFNDIFDKQLKPASSRPSAAPSPHHNASAAANYKSHLTQGRMLVLSRPTPKPIAIPIPQQSPLSSPVTVLERNSEALPSSQTSPKPDKFVPPHLRPGFAGKEERPNATKQIRRGSEPDLSRGCSFGARPSSG